jgi:hypothetical protein
MLARQEVHGYTSSTNVLNGANVGGASCRLLVFDVLRLSTLRCNLTLSMSKAGQHAPHGSF